LDIVQVDDHGRLFISPAITEWASVDAHGIDVVIDLEGGLDECIPIIPNRCVYVYAPIDDDNQELPNMVRLRAIARMAATLMTEGHRVLSHCGMGFNRSALMAGLILVELGMSGPEAVARLKARRVGALYNELFATSLESLSPERVKA
jgi:protein-tyrosine phosphatase